MHFRNNILLYVLVPLVVFFVAASYVRFMVLHSYTVSFEGSCDPSKESCFIGCSDDACTEHYYYSKVHKNDSDLITECGNDVTSCEAASVCLPSDTDCSIAYCEDGGDEDCATSSNESASTTENTLLPQGNSDDTHI